jgi:diadenosine tetraphosphatase ApaH/serine/threonine PP2A family protein phosphatase
MAVQSTSGLTNPANYYEIRKWIAGNQYGPVPEAIVVANLFHLMEVLNQENNVLLLPSPIYICGDIHGQLDDLLFLFEQAHALRPVVDRGPGKSERPQEFDSQRHFIFLGDYVDRGYHSLNTFLYLVCLKLQYPETIFLLRGNHESRQVSTRYGFYHEIILNYGHAGLWMMCMDCFDLLPIAALIDQDVFCVHGGLSPNIPMLEKISLLDRQVELPPSGPLADLCWSDPENVTTWRENTRGAGYLFGRIQCMKFTRINRLDFVARSHQLAQEGYVEYFAGPDRNRGYRLITIWSAPNYSYKSGNMASIMGLRLKDDGPDKKIITFSDAPLNAKIIPPEEEKPVATQYFS